MASAYCSVSVMNAFNVGSACLAHSRYAVVSSVTLPFRVWMSLPASSMVRGNDRWDALPPRD